MMVKRKAHTKAIVLLLSLAMVLSLMAPALAGSSTHSITWVSGTDSVLSTVHVTNDYMTTTPLKNYQTEHKMRLQFSITGDMDVGQAEIRLPAHIFYSRQNLPIGSYEVPLVPAPATGGETLFNYRYDSATDQIVITNYAPVPSGYFLTFDMKYLVNAYQVRDGYTKAFEADFKLSPTGGPVETYTSNPLTIQYETTADLDSLSKSAYATYYNWPGSWGAAPGDADQYFYVVWQIYANALLDDTQPFYFDLREINPAIGGVYGEFIGYSRSGSTSMTRATLAQFHALTNPAYNITSPLGGTTSYNNQSYWTYYVYFRYPRTILEQKTPGVYSATVENQAEAQVEGYDGAGNTLKAVATYPFSYNSNPTPTPAPYTVPVPTAYAYKYNYGTSYGYITKLEQHRSPYRLLTTITNGPFYLSGSAQGWQLTRVDGVYDQQDYTNEILDRRIALSASTTSAGTALGAGDYQLTTFTFYGYQENILINPAAGTTAVRPAAEHARVYLAVEVNGAFQDYGYFQRVQVGTGIQYAFTPIMAGAPAAFTAAAPLVQLPAGTTGIRLRHTNRAYSTSYGGYYLGVEVLDSPAVLSLISGRTSIYVRNTMETRIYDASMTLQRSATASASHQMTRVTPQSYISKTRTEPVNDPANGRYWLNYTVQAYTQATNPETTQAEAAAMNYVLEQRNSTFYELLPPGTQVDYSSILVKGYGNNTYFPANFEVYDNWRGTGRTMLIIRATVPSGMNNYSFSGNLGGYSTISSGMILTFKLYNPWSNVRDNGPIITNYVAYESRDGSLAGGYADVPPASVIPSALSAAMTGLSDMPATWTNMLYASIPLNYDPLTAANAGFSKAVASPEHPAFAGHAQAHAAGQYTYRLRFENAQTMQSKDIVFYDVLENQYGTNPYWQGTLTSVDTSAAAAKGIDVKVYYATQTTDDLAANSLDNNPGFWQALSPATDMRLVKAVAIDLRTRADGSPYIVAPGEILMVNLVMTAPVDADGSLVANGVLAYNASHMSNRKAPVGSSIWDPDLAVERGNTVTVELISSGLDLHKASLPASGSASEPRQVYAEDGLRYLISVSNTNTAQALDRIQVEDSLPPGLTLDPSLITVRVNNNPATDQPLANHPRAHLVSFEGGKLVFYLSSLAGGETITFILPATVDHIAGITDQRDFVNQARVTRLGGQAFLLESETTYHCATAASLTPAGLKTLTGRELQAGDAFSFQLADSQGQAVQTVSNAPPSGAFAFDPLHFDMAGSYVYTIREMPGINDSVVYDPRAITLTVTVAPDASGVLQAAAAYAAEGQVLSQAAFENSYHATSLSATKRWAGGEEPRPPITLRLLRDGVRYGDWVRLEWPETSYTWEGLPKYRADGSLNEDGSRQESVYRASEVAPPPHYQLSYDPDGTIVNTYRPGTFSARKVWRDVPGASATFQLWQTILNDPNAESPYGKLLDTVTLHGVPQADDGVSGGEFIAWLYTWRGLDASGVVEGYPDRVSFEYEVREPNAPTGYVVDATSSASTYIANVNTTVAKTAVKTWVGGAEDEARPQVKLQLLRDGEKLGDPVTLDGQVDAPLLPDGSGERTPWTYTWAKLERFAGGFTGSEHGTVDAQGNPVIPPSVEHVYSFEEVLPVAGYTTEYGLAGWEVINTRLARVGDFVWYDANRNGIQDPGEAGVPGVRVSISGEHLPAGYAASQLTDANGKYLFPDLPPGEYTITFDESTLPAGFAITLTRAPGATAADDSNGLSTTLTLTTEDDLSVDLGVVEVPTQPDITKYINQSMTHLDINNGFNYTYNLIITLPNVIEEYKSFVITDTLDDRLELVSAAFARDKGQYFDLSVQGQTVRAAVKSGGFVPLGDFASVELVITAKVRPGVIDQNIPNVAALAFTDFADVTGRMETSPVTVSPMGMRVLPIAWKTLTGRELQEGDIFTFQLTDSHGQALQTASNQPMSGAAVFESLLFDTAGTYTYTIRELPGALDSVVYDPGAITLTVAVAPDPMAEGALAATAVYTAADGRVLPQAAFENSYHATSLSAAKRWEGGEGPRPPITLRLLRDGVRYGDWVRLEWPETSYTWEGLPKYRADGSLNEDGSRQESVYRASEVAPPPHYQLSYDPDGTIVNTYRPGVFSARKVWRDVPGASATFQLYQTILDDPSPTPYRVAVGAPVRLTGAAVPDDGVSDGEFIAWLYTWRGLEASGEVEGVMVSFEYEVEETDPPADYLIDTTASASTYIANVNTTVAKTAVKTWAGGAEDEARPQVKFQLLQDGEKLGDPVTLDGQADAAPRPDGSGELTPWAYTWKALPRFSDWTGSEHGTVDAQGNPVIPPSVEHVYSFEEVLPVPGYAAEHSPFGWAVTNTRLARVGDFVWHDTNRNGIQDQGEAGVPGVRVSISGEHLPAGYAASQLTDATGGYLFPDLPPGDYTITFDPATLPAGYATTLTRAPGATAANDSNGLVSTVTLTTQDDLTIDLGLVEVPLATPPRYEAIAVPLSAEKRLAGRKLAAGEFTFILRDGAGKAIQEVTNRADGGISFNDRRFSRTGRFIYTIEEKAGSSADIRYDPTVYRVIVEVSASGGRLSAAVSLDKGGTPYAGAIRFQNSVNTPPTGDSALWLPIILIIMAAGFGVGAVALRRKKER